MSCPRTRRRPLAPATTVINAACSCLAMAAALRAPRSGRCLASASARRGTSGTAPRATGAGAAPGRSRSATRLTGTSGSSRPGRATRSLLAGRSWRHPSGASRLWGGGNATPFGQIMPCAGAGAARLVVTHRGRDWRLPGRCVRPCVPHGGCSPDQPARPNQRFPQVKVCGAGGARTHDRRIMRSPASRTTRANCTDDAGYRTDGTRHAGITWRAGPRRGPVSGHPATVRNIAINAQPTSARAGSAIISGRRRR
jgi:hypothetical protein